MTSVHGSRRSTFRALVSTITVFFFFSLKLLSRCGWVRAEESGKGYCRVAHSLVSIGVLQWNLCLAIVSQHWWKKNGEPGKPDQPLSGFRGCTSPYIRCNNSPSEANTHLTVSQWNVRQEDNGSFRNATTVTVLEDSCTKGHTVATFPSAMLRFWWEFTIDVNERKLC